MRDFLQFLGLPPLRRRDRQFEQVGELAGGGATPSHAPSASLFMEKEGWQDRLKTLFIEPTCP